MAALLNVTLPVFMVIGFGYLAVWRGYFPSSGVDGLMKFTQHFAIPCLLFRAVATLDLSASFDPALLLAYYTGSLAAFATAMAGGRYIFKRSLEDSVAIGFAGLFGNTVLLGLPIMERAYGTDSLDPVYVIISVHAAFCYLLGITAMEVVKNRGSNLSSTVKNVGRSIFRNALMIGVALGFVANLSGITLPGPFMDAIDLMIRAALPAALFGLGGVLVEYRPEGDLRAIGFVCAVSLILHPTVAWLMSVHVLGLSTGQTRATVLIASMAPGVNSYIFAALYGHAKRVAASAVLIGTALSIVTVSIWLAILP